MVVIQVPILDVRLVQVAIKDVVRVMAEVFVVQVVLEKVSFFVSLVPERGKFILLNPAQCVMEKAKYRQALN